MSKVYIEHRKTNYPSPAAGFAPSKHYPEYRWSDISSEANEVYDMVRECLHGYGLDRDHFGTREWNPLGDIIRKGDTVVVKPNWVEDKNENKNGGIECLVTNASVVRAVIDYVFIALEGTGRLVVGDSPMPDCDFESLMEKAGYNAVWRSCLERGIVLEVKDLREDIVTGFANEVKETDGSSEKVIDLGKDSLFADSEYNIGKYRNGIIDATKMNEFYHVSGHHRYGINRTLIEADVIINLPKPKTHRKAGYTAALKNYIGICSRKSSIPHNVMGNEKEGGDTYFGPKFIFETEQRIRDIQNKLQAKQHHALGFLVKCARTPFWIFRRLTHKKYFGTGNWYKNDTIWRSILDINRIILYADKEGNLTEQPQRRFFSLGDMVVAGHRNGPLAPTPIETGVILCSEDPVAFDLAVINLMGLKYEYLPVLNRIPGIERYPLHHEPFVNTKIMSNEPELDGTTVDCMPVGIYGCFAPADGWGVISVDSKGVQ